jgi:TatD DNase family protein
MTFNLVDFHCHLDLYPNPEAAILDCERAGVYTLTVTTTPKAWPHNKELTSKARFVRAALGIHPQLVADRASEIKIWESYLSQTRYVGEVGLDAGPRFYQSLDLQKQVFQRVLTLCDQAGGKILTIHSVRTATMVLDMLEQHLRPDHSRVILHWFTGTKAEARRAVDLGCYFSINAEMFKSDRHRNTISSLPLDRVLTETDGPLCKNNGQPVRPIDASIVINLLAGELRITPDAIAKTILSNLTTIEAFR